MITSPSRPPQPCYKAFGSMRKTWQSKVLNWKKRRPVQPRRFMGLCAFGRSPRFGKLEQFFGSLKKWSGQNRGERYNSEMEPFRRKRIVEDFGTVSHQFSDFSPVFIESLVFSRKYQAVTAGFSPMESHEIPARWNVPAIRDVCQIFSCRPL